MSLLTHSRMSSFKLCRKQHEYRYEIGLRKQYGGKALRMGSAFHEGVEAIGNGADVQEACDAAYRSYGSCPSMFDPYEWDVEAETVARMVSGYAWRWSAAPLEYLAVEMPFELPLMNPATKRASKTFRLAGKIDAIVRLEDGRIAVKETKLFGDDIGMDSELWRRMRIDQQVSLYILAARRLGFDARTVLYDVARKPSIAPVAIPVVDDDGIKIVVDREGVRVKNANGSWKQTSDSKLGFSVWTRPMSPVEWGEKLTNDIVERPDFYYSRVEVPRIEDDLVEFEYEVWDVAKTIMEAQTKDRHYRTVNKNTCGFCEYFDLCSTRASLESVAPAGFEYVTDFHPELKTEKQNVSTSPSPADDAATGCTPETGPAASADESYW